MPSNSRHVKKLLYQFLRRQLVLSKSDRGEVFQFRSRQVLRRGSLPDLALHSIVEQGVRYLILLHFPNFVSVYFADPQGTIVNVKNFDRKRDQHTLEELPRLARRILEYPRKKKVLAKHERLLQKAEALQHRFRATVHGIEKLVGVRLSPKKIPGIALTEQAQEGVLHIPTHLRTQPQLDHFFTTEAFRLLVPAVFQSHAEMLARFLTYVFVKKPPEQVELLDQLPESLQEMVSSLPPEVLTRHQIKPIIALLRLWARYEDRVLCPNVFQLFFRQTITKVVQKPTRNLMELAALVSEALFQEHADPRDLVRMTCFLVLSDNQALIQAYRNHEVFLSPGDVPRFCHAMLTLRLCQVYPIKPQIMGQFIGRKLGHLLQRAFEQLHTWILRVERAKDRLTLVNQSDLDLIDVNLRESGTAPENVLATIPQLDTDSAIDIPLTKNLGTEQLVFEFKDRYDNHYRLTV